MSLHRISRRVTAFVFGLCVASACASAVADAATETSYDGLQLVPSKNVQMLYVRPGASFAPYQRVAIADCYVAFRKNWQRDQNSSGLRVSAKDMERIKTNLAADFRKIFVETLQKDGGYQVVDQVGDDVLVVRPAIIDLDVAAPDKQAPGRSRTFATSAGAMTLYLELYDGATGEILARVVDPREGRDLGRMMWQNSVTNKAEADRMLRRWAELMRNALERARANPVPAAAPAEAPAATP